MTAVRSERYMTTRRSFFAAVAGGGLGALVAACTAGAHTAADSGTSVDAPTPAGTNAKKAV